MRTYILRNENKPLFKTKGYRQMQCLVVVRLLTFLNTLLFSNFLSILTLMHKFVKTLIFSFSRQINKKMRKINIKNS